MNPALDARPAKRDKAMIPALARAGTIGIGLTGARPPGDGGTEDLGFTVTDCPKNLSLPCIIQGMKRGAPIFQPDCTVGNVHGIDPLDTFKVFHNHFI